MEMDRWAAVENVRAALIKDGPGAALPQLPIASVRYKTRPLVRPAGFPSIKNKEFPLSSQWFKQKKEVNRPSDGGWILFFPCWAMLGSAVIYGCCLLSGEW